MLNGLPEAELRPAVLALTVLDELTGVMVRLGMPDQRIRIRRDDPRRLRSAI